MAAHTSSLKEARTQPTCVRPPEYSTMQIPTCERNQGANSSTIKEYESEKSENLCATTCFWNIENWNSRNLLISLQIKIAHEQRNALTKSCEDGWCGRWYMANLGSSVAVHCCNKLAVFGSARCFGHLSLGWSRSIIICDSVAQEKTVGDGQIRITDECCHDSDFATGHHTPF